MKIAQKRKGNKKRYTSSKNIYHGNSIRNLKISNTYMDGAGTDQTTNLITRQLYSFTGNGTNFTLNYTYDNIGNITRIYDNNNNNVGRYMYDMQNQLVYEEIYDNGTCQDTRVYEYDTYGNIRKVKHCSGYGFASVSEATGYGTLLSTETYCNISFFLCCVYSEN